MRCRLGRNRNVATDAIDPKLPLAIGCSLTDIALYAFVDWRVC